MAPRGLKSRESAPISNAEGLYPSGVSVQVRLVSGREMLDRLGPALDELHEATDAPITARRPWLRIWTDTHPDHEAFGAAVVGASQRLEAAALLARRAAGRVAEIVTLGHGPSDYARLPARSAEAARALAGGVVDALRATPGPWQLRLEQLPTGDPAARAIKSRLRWAMFAEGDGAPKIVFGEERTPAAHLSRAHRANVRGKWNRIRRQGLDAAITHERDAAKIEELLPQVEAVRRERDLALRGQSDLEDPRMAAFWHSVIVELARSEEVELTTLHLQGELAAYVVCFLDRGAWRQWDGRVSPRWERFGGGRLVYHESILRALADRRFAEYDWMRGLEEYKLALSTDVAGAEHLLAWSSLAAAAARGLPLLAKSALRPAKGRHPWLARGWDVLRKASRGRRLQRLGPDQKSDLPR